MEWAAARGTGRREVGVEDKQGEEEEKEKTRGEFDRCTGR